MKVTIYEDADSGGVLEVVASDAPEKGYLAGSIVVDVSEKGEARPRLLAATVELRALMPSITRPHYEWLWLEMRKESEWTLDEAQSRGIIDDLTDMVLDGDRVVIYGKRETGNAAVLAAVLLESIEPVPGDPIERIRATIGERSAETTGQATVIYELLGTLPEYRTCDGYWQEVAKRKAKEVASAKAVVPAEPRVWLCDNCHEYYDDEEVTLYKSTDVLAGCKADGCAGTCKPVGGMTQAARQKVQPEQNELIWRWECSKCHKFFKDDEVTRASNGNREVYAFCKVAGCGGTCKLRENASLPATNNKIIALTGEVLK